MAKFFVGQRVRVVGLMESGEAGVTQAEAVIAAGPGEFKGATFGKTYAWEAVLSTGCFAGEYIVGDSSDFEPITPDGAQPSEFTTLHDLLESLEGVAA